MEIQTASNRIHPTIERVGRFIAVCVLVLAATVVSAQNEYWPVATLQPPGLGAQLTPIAGVALAGDVAVTVYKQTQTLGYRVFLRKRNAQQAWDAPQLLVQGQPGEGEGVTVSADADHIAIGLPKVDTYGRVDVYVRNGTNWTLQQGIPAAPGAGPVTGPSPNFGYVVSLRQSLLVVSSGDLTFTSQFDTYRYDAANGNWILAGYSLQTVTSTKAIAKTDGQRVASCYDNTCRSFLYSNGQFFSEGGFYLEGVSAFEIDANWFFVRADGNLDGYRRIGSSWSMSQQFGLTNNFAVYDGRMIKQVYVTQSPAIGVYVDDGNNVWQLISTAEDPAPIGGTAISQDYALSGIQSLHTETGPFGPWSPSGTVEGVADMASFGFGTAVSLASNRVWIGSPRYNNDFGSGAVWMDSLDGNSPVSPRFRDAPAFSASNVGFGQTIATDGVRVAVASAPAINSLAPVKVRVYLATSISPIVMEITAPLTAFRATGVDLTIQGSTLALFRRSNGVAEALIYVDLGAGYVLNQTLPLPPTAVNKVLLQGDLLIFGQMQFQRSGGATGNFSAIDPIVNPPGVVLNFSRMSRYGNLLVIAANFPDAAEPIARVFSLTPAGWTYSGDISRGTFPSASCFYPAASPLATNGTGTIACMTGTTLSIATPNPVGNDWTVIRSASVPGLTNGPFNINGVAIDGEHVAIGEPGPSRVVVVDLTESIFSAGFDQ